MRFGASGRDLESVLGLGCGERRPAHPQPAHIRNYISYSDTYLYLEYLKLSHMGFLRSSPCLPWATLPWPTLYWLEA